MKKLLLLVVLLFALAAAPVTYAQNTVTVTAAQISSSPGTLLPAGTIIFQATDATGKPINYQIGGGGQNMSFPTVCGVTNGAINQPCILANTATANPTNFCYAVTLKNSANQVVLGGNPYSGYQCLQPTVSNTWCSAASCNLDNFQPTVPQKTFTLPTPTSTTLGGIFAGDCGPGLVSIGYGPTGLPDCVANGAGGGGVWGGITGTLTNQADLSAALALKSPLASPSFNGTPSAPTPPLGDNSTRLATTAFINTFPIVWGRITGSLSSQTDLNNVLIQLAPLASPNFTGNPTSTTPATADSSTSISTTAYVQAQGYAPLASPGFTGTPTAPTPTTADSSTKLATTAWVNAQGYSSGSGNVTGPGSSLVGHIALFNSTNGQLLSDSGVVFPLAPANIGTLLAGSNGLAASATTDVTNATNISTGTLPAARLPNPTLSSLGGVSAVNSVIHKFANSISTSGVVGLVQPSCADLSNGATSCSTDTTNASNISSGTLAVARGGTGTNSTLTGIIRGGGSTFTGNELSGDAVTSGSNAVTVKGLNGTLLSGLATGILKITTSTGVPSIAVAADFPTLNQNTTGNAATASSVPVSGITPGTNAASGTFLFSQPTALAGSTPDYSFIGAASDTNTAGVLRVDTPLGSHQPSLSVGSGTVDQMSVCWQPGPQGEIVFGSAVTCTGMGVSPFAKVVESSLTGYHTVLRLFQLGTIGPLGGTILEMNNALTYNSSTAPFNIWTACTGASSNSNCGSGTIIASLRGDGLMTATQLAQSGTVTSAYVFGNCTGGSAAPGWQSLTGCLPAGVAIANSFTNLNSACAGAQTWGLAGSGFVNAAITLTGACTLNLTSPLTGGQYVLKVIQGSGGSHTLALGTGCTWLISNSGHGAILPSLAVGSVDTLSFTYDGTNCLANYSKSYN